MPVMKSTSLKLKGGKRKSFYNKNKRPRKSRHSKRKNTRRKNTRRRSKYSKRRKHLRRFKGGASIEQQPANVAELITILDKNNIDVKKWGKTPENLMEEITKGESYLETNDETGVLVRVVSVAKIKIYKERDTSTYLIEEYQIKDGKRKAKGGPLAEKIGNGEIAMDGIIRGINEELGEPLASLVLVDPKYYKVDTETKPSQSFQGLECIYLMHNFKGTASEGFPEGPFETQDAHDGKTIGWNWQTEKIIDEPEKIIDEPEKIIDEPEKIIAEV